MLERISAEILEYCNAHSTPERAAYKELVDYTYAHTESPRMLSGPQVGGLLQLLIKLSRAERVLEIGTFTGYSALKMAEALPASGDIHTCESDRRNIEVAEQFMDRFPWGKQIIIHYGPALDTLRKLDPPFDLAFIDADKENYLNYYLTCKTLVRSGGVIVLDNTLWSGLVLSPQDGRSRAIAQCNDHITADPEVMNILLPLRDGIMVALKS